VKSFLAFLAVIAVIGVFWLVIPLLDRQDRDQEERLVASLNLVETAIVSTSADILRVDLFSPQIDPLAGDGRWKLTGIVETQNSAGKPVDLRFAAAIAYTCTPYEQPDCGKVQTLTIEGTPLVVDGAVVAELQTVMNAAAVVPGEAPPGPIETAPSDAPPAGTTSVLPAPHTDAAAVEAAPATTLDTAPATTPEVAIQTPTPAPVAPTDAEPIQGERLIFLVQKRLRELGYDPGPVDGRVGPRTTTAIQSFQDRSGLAVDGQPSTELLDHLIRTPPAIQ